MNCVLTVFNEFFSLMNNVPEDLYLPVIWFEAIAKVTPNSASLIQNLLNLPNIVTIVCLVTIVTNLLCVIVLIFRIYRISLQKEFKIAFCVTFGRQLLAVCKNTNSMDTKKE